jgi:hypothetical protein
MYRELIMVSYYNESRAFLEICFSISGISKKIHISFIVCQNLGLSGLEIGEGLLRIF